MFTELGMCTCRDARQYLLRIFHSTTRHADNHFKWVCRVVCIERWWWHSDNVKRHTAGRQHVFYRNVFIVFKVIPVLCHIQECSSKLFMCVPTAHSACDTLAAQWGGKLAVLFLYVNSSSYWKHFIDILLDALSYIGIALYLPLLLCMCTVLYICYLQNWL